MENNKTPQLRFNNFSSEWKVVRLGDIGEFKSNGVDKKINAKEQIINLLNYMDVYNKRHITASNCFNLMQVTATKKQISENNVKKGDVFFTPSSETAEDIGHVLVVEETLPNTCYSYHLMRFRPNENTFYLYFPNYAFESEFVRSQLILAAQGVQRFVLRKDNFEDTICLLPDLAEQEKLGNYFRDLDKLIATNLQLVEKLKNIKSANLQSMFPQPGETTPRVRFKGFTGDWETTKLSSLAKRVTRKNNNLETQLPLTISSQYGLVSQLDYFNNVVASANLSGYYLIKRGEFAYNKSYSTGYPFGSVKRLDSYDMGALSTLYIVFEVASGVSSNYLACFFDTSLWYGEVSQRAAEGARNHGLLNISAEDFLDINIMMPKSQTEQELIASYFRELDNQIRLHEQKLEKLKQIKASCLDKMFV